MRNDQAACWALIGPANYTQQNELHLIGSVCPGTYINKLEYNLYNLHFNCNCNCVYDLISSGPHTLAKTIQETINGRSIEFWHVIANKVHYDANLMVQWPFWAMQMIGSFVAKLGLLLQTMQFNDSLFWCHLPLFIGLSIL